MVQRLRGMRFFVAALVLGSSSLPALTQAPVMQQQPGQPGPNGNYPGVGIPDNLSVNISLIDRSFISDTMKSDLAQLEMSKMAAQKASNDEVKQYGQEMVQSRTQLNSQLDPVAKQLNISDPDKPSKQGKQELDKLQTLSGADFDSAYLQAMAKEQQHSLKEFKEEEQGTKSGYLQQLAKQDQTTLVSNYQFLQKLAAAHNVAIGK